MTAQPTFVKALALTLALDQPPPSLVPLAAMLDIMAQTALKHVIKGPVIQLVVTRLLVSVMCVRLVNLGRLLVVLGLVLPTVVLHLLVKTTVTAQRPTVLVLLWAARV